jgi:hypothetical membrane protein
VTCPRRWSLASAGVAPIALIGGWTVAAARQPQFDSLHQTISALAAHSATDRWIMTAGLAALGACHVVTAAGMSTAGRAGRVILGLGGVATLAVALFPQPQQGSSGAHVSAAAIGFVCLTTWPLLAADRSRAGWSALGQRSSCAAFTVLLALLIWFVTQLDGDLAGLTERVLAAAQALWPLVVVVSELTARRTEHRLGASS